MNSLAYPSLRLSDAPHEHDDDDDDETADGMNISGENKKTRIAREPFLNLC